MEEFNFQDLPDPGNRYLLESCLGEGVYGSVFQASDTQAGNKKVAIKVQNYNVETESFIAEEYRILRDYAKHENLPEFYGVFKNCQKGKNEVWLVMELCSGGPITDLVNGLLSNNRRMSEEHIAFILREIVKVLVYFHDNKILHRDIRGSNILLTKNGELKLVDFGLSKVLAQLFDKSSTSLGSPSWMAPEVVAAEANGNDGYDSRADVWALGIVAIELGNGKPPFQSMHPTRALFQILRNPPPTLEKPANWSELYNDFISECLVKNPEHRPLALELIEHPFITSVPDNTYHLTQKLQLLSEEFSACGKTFRHKERVVHSNYLKEKEVPPKPMNVEDLAALNKISESIILTELHSRLEEGQTCTFIGDVLLVLNPNKNQDIYNDKQQNRYKFQSRSSNVAHIYSVADSAYQAAFHHNAVQHIILSGESGSGKTTNFWHIIDQLLHLGQTKNINQNRIKNALHLIHSLVSAATPVNENSTRCILRTQIMFGDSGKNTGAKFEVSQLDKWRVSSMDMNQSNFHILYYFYDGIAARGELNKYLLDEGRTYRYLRVLRSRPASHLAENANEFNKIISTFAEFEFTGDQVQSILNMFSAILNLGNIKFLENEDQVEIENEKYAKNVASLLDIDKKKLIWALKNYCFIRGKTAERRKHTCEEARDARDVLANTLYFRIVEYIVGFINHELSYGRTIFGDKYSVKVMDLFGFECFLENHYAQFLINCINEQLHYHYLQRIFCWEDLETNEENIPYKPIYYYNNKDALNELLSSSGVLSLIDSATRQNMNYRFLIDGLKRTGRKYVYVKDNSEFSVNHFTGRVVYKSREMPEHNREFLPPDVVEALRTSNNPIVKMLFLSKLNKNGNLQLTFGTSKKQDKLLPLEDSSKLMYDLSQTKNMKTVASSFKSYCVELLKELSVGGGTGGTHFVKCIRSDLENKPNNFFPELVRQQLRGTAILETAKARKRGFTHRVPFAEFLKRYQFLAFDFDENVDVTKDNCRLLLLRLNMEGWIIGKSKVFLKYYNEEYLSRLYETNVKKVIKIQSMIRSYLAKRKMAKKVKLQQKVAKPKELENEKFSEDEAATIVQNAYRKHLTKRLNESYDELSLELKDYIRPFFDKWKNKSIYQVLLQYRAQKFQELYNLSQQIHLYNQSVFNNLLQSNNTALKSIDPKAKVETWLSTKKQAVSKLPFRLDEVPYFDTSYMCDHSPTTEQNKEEDEEDSWDAPFKWRETVSSQITSSIANSYEDNGNHKNKLIEIPYVRSTSEPMAVLPEETSDCEQENDEGQNNDIQADENQQEETRSDDIQNNDGDDIHSIDDIKASSTNNSCVNEASISTSASNDFEFIKPTVKEMNNKKDFKNPIAELETIGRLKTSNSEDDPPFNFQSILRKTNYQRQSIKREQEVDQLPYTLKKRENHSHSHKPESQNDFVSTKNTLPLTEVTPGIYMQGFLVEV